MGHPDKYHNDHRTLGGDPGMSENLKRTVKCECEHCENFNIEIYLEEDLGAETRCGGRHEETGEECGRVLAPEAEWFKPPTPEELGLPSPGEQIIALLASMTPEERAALANLINPEPDPQD